MRSETLPASGQATSQVELPVLPPFRLDLTVAALRRLATNPIDVVTPAGEYARALAGTMERAPAGRTAGPQPTVLRVVQAAPDRLTVCLRGDPAGHATALDLVRRMLGTERDLSDFYLAAAGIPWLAPLAERMRGLKPPRYPTLWEACVNAIVFQQVSVHAASNIMRRLVEALGQGLADDGVALRVFPPVESILAASDDLLRAAGLSAAKMGALRRAGETLARGELEEATLEACDSAEAARRLRLVKGIGPWTAALILLRGLGRLDVFPANDSGVARSLSFVAGSERVDVHAELERLGAQRGMLYFHLLLARLEARGEIGRPTTP